MTTRDPKAPAAQDPFLEQMGRELAGWRDPVARLRQALERDELQLFSQPILSLRPPGAFVLAEVLVRLREEEARLLPPGEFLPVFEHYKMMPALDRWVVTNTLRWLANPPAQALRRLSVNVSSQTLEDAGFAQFVDEALRAARVAPQALVFEIDESDTLTRLDLAARFAQAVRKIGCRVLIDGFGQRSVSFLALETMRADFVKVDGCIVRALQRSDVAQQKLKAIVRVGEAIGIEVIGECVEEDDILAQLRAMKVDYAQGFGIARPAPIEGAVPPSAP